MTIHSRRLPRAVVAGSALALVCAPLSVVGSATAAPDGDEVVINEAYLNGGSTGATYLNKFVELYNPTDDEVSLDGWSVQYRPYNGTAAFTSVIALSGHIEPGGTYLVSGNSNAANGTPLPTPDVASNVGFSGNANGGTLALAAQSGALTGTQAEVLADPELVDLVVYGTSNTAETAPRANGYSVTESLNRTAGADSDDNSVDFTSAAPTPMPCGEDCVGGVDPGDPTEATIAEIQGTGADSPMVNDAVITRGVVTAAYPTGGFNGFYLQTEGSGGTPDATPGASDGIFVFGSAVVGLVEAGDFVEVTGTVSEFNGLTEITPSTDGVEVLAEPFEAIKDTSVAYPADNAGREALEGMLIQPQGDYTVTDNFNLNNFGEIGLASGTETLAQPTDVAPPFEVGGDNTEYNAVLATNAAKKVALDDGSSTNYLGSAVNKAIPLPWLTVEKPIRVGAAVTFTEPVIIDFRNNAWKFQPTEQLTAANAAAVQPATFENTREAAPEDVGGDVTLASFNVLNYFTETGVDFVADGGACEYFTDRDSNPITVDECSGEGPRGAANDVNLARQEAKIVNAINTLDASVLSLEEIENSIKYGADRDAALSTLVDALNADAGTDKWTYVPSPEAVPTGEDVIRTAFIYQPDEVETVGASEILIDPAFDNAREPLAQAFAPVDGGDDSTFVVVVNHFKSKSSGSGVDADQGDGQGASNFSRTLQSEALVDFADAFATEAGTEKVFLTGDFNSYTQEDPMQLLYDAGYTDLGSTLTGEDTYLFGGLLGSLDHVLASDAALDDVVGADVWNINSVESVALEYSRYNYNATLFYEESPFRSSDHDPLIVGVDLPEAPGTSSVVATVDDTVYGTAPKVAVTVTADPEATGRVEVREGTRLLGTGTLAGGAVDVRLGRFALKPGDHTLTVDYLGNDTTDPASTQVELTVAKVAPTLTSKVAPAKVIVKKTKARVTVTVTSPVVTPSGEVTVSRGAVELATGSLVNGRVTLRLPVFATVGAKTVQVDYAGNDLVAAAHAATTIRVVRR